MDENTSEATLRKRDKFRNTICSGCRSNYYNFPYPGNGIDAPVPEGYACWNIKMLSINRKERPKCWSEDRSR